MLSLLNKNILFIHILSFSLLNINENICLSQIKILFIFFNEISTLNMISSENKPNISFEMTKRQNKYYYLLIKDRILSENCTQRIFSFKYLIIRNRQLIR